MEIDFINQWKRDEVFNDFTVIDISYESIKFRTTDHIVTLVIMGIGVWISWGNKYDIR